LEALVATIVREVQSLGYHMAQDTEAADRLLASSEAQQAGGAIFAAHCAICHGVNGDGRGQRREGMSPPPANLTLPPWSDPASADRTFLAIRNGVPTTAMPASTMLSDREVWSVVAYIMSLKDSSASER
jgi:high-affinity iron transporter